MFSIIFPIVGTILSFIGIFFNSDAIVIVGIVIFAIYLYMGSVMGQLKSPVLDIVFVIIGIFVSLNLEKKWWYGIALGLAVCEIGTQVFGLLMVLVVKIFNKKTRRV